MVEDGKADWDFMRTFTDAPLLVRTDTGKRLRAEELARGEARDPGPAAGVGLGEYGAKAPPVGTAPEVKYSEKLPHGVEPLSTDRYVVWDADARRAGGRGHRPARHPRRRRRGAGRRVHRAPRRRLAA